MLRKLFPSRLSSSPPISHSSRLLAFQQMHSLHQNDDVYDPPFSPISDQTQTQNNNKSNRKKNDPIPNKDATGMVSSDLPFDFMHSYSENSTVDPIGFRESPKFSPFGPGRLDRKWTGTAAPARHEFDTDVVAEERTQVLGDPLTEDEVSDLVEQYRHNNCARQINLAPTLVIGKGGVTHNSLDDIHNHWKRAEAVRITCFGVPTLDMDNICLHIEEKSGGKIIYRDKNVILLYRGRNYDPKSRPMIPIMLWKPHAPIYPRLVKDVADGLTLDETKELRNKGLSAHPLMILTRNGFYANVVRRVREAFEVEEVVRLDCKHVGTNDCKKIGVKLRDLVPCVPILIKDEQIILWRGKKD